MTPDELHDSIKVILDLHRSLRQHEDSVEKKRIQIRVHVTE